MAFAAGEVETGDGVGARLVADAGSALAGTGFARALTRTAAATLGRAGAPADSVWLVAVPCVAAAAMGPR